MSGGRGPQGGSGSGGPGRSGGGSGSGGQGGAPGADRTGSAIQGGGYRNLVESEVVEFEVKTGPKGLQAAEVRRASVGAE